MYKKVNESNINGLLEFIPNVVEDKRGSFVKTFMKSKAVELGLNNREFVEEYYTVSTKGVLRGLHFQTPPHEHDKMVYCCHGKVLDLVVDLRRGSPTYKQFQSYILDSSVGKILWIPKGLAHGFFTLSENAIMVYRVTTEYAKENDHGILWNSVGYDWPCKNPILSERDAGFTGINEYDSPFEYKEYIQEK